MRVAPPSIVRREIAPGRARPQNPVMAETDVRYTVPLITILKKWFIYDMIFNRERCRIAGGNSDKQRFQVEPTTAICFSREAKGWGPQFQERIVSVCHIIPHRERS